MCDVLKLAYPVQEGKSQIRCDASLKKIFDRERLDLDDLPNLLDPHLRPAEPYSLVYVIRCAVLQPLSFSHIQYATANQAYCCVKTHSRYVVWAAVEAEPSSSTKPGILSLNVLSSLDAQLPFCMNSLPST